MYCRNCGKQIGPDAGVCVACGVIRGRGTTFCDRCGGQRDPNADYCVTCGVNLRQPGAPSAGVSTARRFGFATGPVVQAPGNELPPETFEQWNWGAFLLPWLWPYYHGDVTLKIITGAATVVSLVTLGIPLLALGIYLGFRGNAIAAQHRVYGSTEHFAVVEHAWMMSGLIAVASALSLTALIIFLRFMIWLTGH